MGTGKADQWNRGVFLALRTLMHVIAAVQFWYGLYYDFYHVVPPKDHPAWNRFGGFGGKFKYLTILDAIVQAIYFTVSIVNDVIGTNEVAPRKPPTIRRIKDYLMATFAFPLALNVGITFWALMTIDRELVMPKSFDVFFPSWLNHVMHSNIVVFIVLELFITFRQYPSRKKGLFGLTFFMVAYLVWIHIIRYMTGFWVYPILEVLNFGQRIIFFLVNLVFGLSLYFVGELFNNKIWTYELRQLKQTGKKHK